MDENAERMDCGVKIRVCIESDDWMVDEICLFQLCRTLASVMSELFSADIYCGATKMENFFVYYLAGFSRLCRIMI